MLAVGAHPDDIELGCGGALFAHRQAGDEVALLVVTAGERGPGGLIDFVGRRAEQEQAAQMLGARLFWGTLPDCDVTHSAETVELIERAIDEVGANLVYVHAPDDSHQDHRAVSAATLSAARRLSQVLHYQSPSSLGFVPRVFVDISEHLDDKLAAVGCHRSQVRLSEMVEPDVVAATARYFGAQARLGLAEGFVPARMVFEIAPERSAASAAHGARAVAESIG